MISSLGTAFLPHRKILLNDEKLWADEHIRQDAKHPRRVTKADAFKSKGPSH
jgi:hypothetical protein